MDRVNRFHTKETWLWVRAEHVGAVLVLSTMAALHARELDWGRFAAAFVLIDLVGYVPGAIAFSRAGGRPISPVYHHLYNFTHNYLTAAVAVAVWAAAIGHCEWAMLALPIHLSGDRGIFGNTYKPVSLPFEPADPRGQ
ncbi:MAG TPA: hypothetical protein VEU51_12690, partial [Candidatus Acidoferrales bacterium]|nr:hypothetical protein [Candidatus Acidoferrales bacterium]